MKKNICGLFVLSALLCASSAGCAGSSSSEGGSSALTSAQTETAAATSDQQSSEAHDSTAAEQDTEASEKPSSKSEMPSDSTKKFNYDEAVRSVTLCGHEINAPVTLNELGDDFSIDYEFDEIGTSNCIVSFYYKNGFIGTATYNFSSSPDEIDRDTNIAGVYISTDKFVDIEVPVITVNGIGLGDERTKVTDEFGKSHFEMAGNDLYMERTEKERSITFGYKYPEYETVDAIEITWN